MNKNILLLIILLFSAHSSPQLNPLGIPLTCYPLLIILPYIYFENSKEYSNLVFKRIGLLLITFSVFFIFSIGTSYYLDHIKHIIQTAYGLLAGFSLFIIYNNLAQKNILKKGIFIFLFTILTLSFLERFFPFYREFAFNISDRLLSGADLWKVTTNFEDNQRAILISGFIRPIVFSPENSVLGRTIFSIALSLIILLDNFKNKLFLSLLILSAYFITGSPACVLFFFCFVVSSLLEANLKTNNFNYLSIFNLSLLGISPFFIYSIFKYRIEEFSLILEQIDSLSLKFLLQNSSEFIRLVLPILSLQKVFSINPIFGLGYGAEEYLPKLIYGESIITGGVFVNNNLLYPLICFGILGFSFLIILILKYKPRFMQIPPSCYPYLFVFFIYNGGFVEPRFWINFFSILSSIYIVNYKKHTKTKWKV